MSDHLLDLTREMEDIHREIQDALGEVTPELEARLDSCGHALAVKVDNMAAFMADLKAKSAGLKAFAKAVRHKAEIADNLEARLLKYCDLALGDKDAIAGDLFTLKRRKNPGKVIVSDEDALRACLPEAFEKVVDWKICKPFVKARLGVEPENIKGAHIEHTTRVEIK